MFINNNSKYLLRACYVSETVVEIYCDSINCSCNRIHGWGFNGAIPCPRASPMGALLACRAGWNGPCGKAKSIRRVGDIIGTWGDAVSFGSYFFCRLVNECGLNVFCVPGAVLGAEDPEKRTGQSSVWGWKGGQTVLARQSKRLCRTTCVVWAIQKMHRGTWLMVQWLGLCASTAGGHL